MNLQLDAKGKLRSTVTVCLIALVWIVLAWIVSTAGVYADDAFPRELVDFVEAPQNPVFTGAGPGHWDAKIRERGWILREGNTYKMWYTGYDGTREGIKQLGYATSPDGLTWTRYPENPIDRDDWVEDMIVIPHRETYYMFAEGRGDHAHWLTSPDGIHWKRMGTLDIRKADGNPIAAGPFGTPTVWFENGKWYLLYEQRDLGVWLATSADLSAWKLVQDDPVLTPGPGNYDAKYIAVNQVLVHNGKHYAFYHGSAGDTRPSLWTTDVAVSDDLLHWKKYAGNPLFPVAQNKSSGILVDDGTQLRLYTMHDEVRVHFPKKK